MRIEVSRDVFRLAQVFTISRGSRTEAQVLTVTLGDRAHRGWGECVPYARYGETLDSVTTEIEGLPDAFGRRELQDLLPAGAARNAVDWENGFGIWPGWLRRGPRLRPIPCRWIRPRPCRRRPRKTPFARC
jgi:hypothetical protein